MDRTALLDRVAASNARVIAITAAAGYGKSRFARSIAQAFGGARVADCAEMVNVSTAVRALLRALGPFEREFEDRQSRLILGLPRDGSSDERWRDVLVEAIERTDSSSTLSVENGEFLSGRPEVAELVDRTLNGANRRTIFCSRIPINLASISRIPPNESYAIGTADLEFTSDEIRALFAPLGVPTSLTDRVIELARGWPIAVLTFYRAACEKRLDRALAALEDPSEIRPIAEYTLTQALGSLSEAARDVLAATAIIGKISDLDLHAMSAGSAALTAELDACPFVSRVDGGRELHPLAVAALAGTRAVGTRLLLLAAANTEDPIRAAQLYVAAGDADSAADVIDRSVAPFMTEEPTPAIAALVASLDEAVLVRHPTTWNATWMNRGYTVPSQRMLFESRTVWAALADDAPPAVRFGVGLSLLSWLFFLGHADEAEPVFQSLERLLDGQPPMAPMPLLVAAHRELAKMRRGKPADAWPSLLPAWDATFGASPMVAAMGCYALKGPLGFLNGRRGESRRAFALGVELASTANSETVHVIAIKNAAFFAWLSGENELLTTLVNQLRAASAPNVAEATRHFLGCATSDAPARTPTGYELPVYRAYGWFVAAGRESTLEGRRVALRAAIDAASQDGQPWIVALAWATLGLADRSARDMAFRRARRHAEKIEYPAFRKAINDVIHDRIPETWAGLRAFAPVSQTQQDIRISLAARDVHVGSKKISLSPREAELLFALALHSTPRDRSTLAAMIWPDVDEKNVGIIGVYIGRLRRRLGDPALIESRGSGYALSKPATVDLLLLEEAIKARRVSGPFEAALEEMVSSEHVRLPQWVLTSSWLAPYVLRLEEAICQVRTMRASEAEQASHPELARHYNHLLVAEDSA